ncbi:hypothetical protein [Nesterenkonia ebinurensis]|uniref:hypothetical protein n=1 Tax=Nesterenkonia ebinurensis TaxID=2608252 RepID=UPI00123D556E|nr:hypothetical protein [Nesterenkonia ebinurensis]
MGLFDFLLKKEESWEESDAYTGETPPCPDCGTPLTKRYVYSGMYCSSCWSGLRDEDDEESDDGDALSVYDAAQIWVSNGKDEDYMFGYSRDELENAL